jgi:hypothetical protein
MIRDPHEVARVMPPNITIHKRSRSMPSMQTIYRAIIMVAVGVVAVKAWHLYGPTNEQVKSTLTQVVETVQSAINSRQTPSANAPPDPRLSAPPIAAAPQATPPPASAAPAEPPRLLPQATPPAAANIEPQNALGAGCDPVPQLLSRLQSLGATNTNLAPWGGNGSLYRFTCRAPLASAPAMTQHFESIAAEPAAAVEQVLAKVEAWRVAQRDGGILRY